MIIKSFYQPFPIIDLGDIILRELTDDDAQDYFDYMSKNEMKQFLTSYTLPSDLDHALREVRYWGSLFPNKRSIYWGIVYKETNKLIGTLGFNMIAFNSSRGDLSYDLDYAFWGKGIMLKSVKAVLNFADFTLALIRVEAKVLVYNHRSTKLLKRCGFVQEGLMKKYDVIQGEYKDYFLYARVLSI